MQISLSSYVVLFADGSINHEATVAKFAGDLSRFEAERELEANTIGTVIHALFDKHLGKKIPTPFVVSEALKALNAQPENYKVLSDKVAEFIKVSPEFVTTRGKGGGVARIADMND